VGVRNLRAVGWPSSLTKRRRWCSNHRPSRAGGSACAQATATSPPSLGRRRWRCASRLARATAARANAAWRREGGRKLQVLLPDRGPWWIWVALRGGLEKDIRQGPRRRSRGWPAASPTPNFAARPPRVVAECPPTPGRGRTSGGGWRGKGLRVWPKRCSQPPGRGGDKRRESEIQSPSVTTCVPSPSGFTSMVWVAPRGVARYPRALNRQQF